MCEHGSDLKSEVGENLQSDQRACLDLRVHPIRNGLPDRLETSEGGAITDVGYMLVSKKVVYVDVVLSRG